MKNNEITGQMTLFDFILPVKNKFNPIEEFAKFTHTSGCQERVAKFFSEHTDSKERATFLKNEYGWGGASYAANGIKPDKIVAYEFDAKGCKVKYYVMINGKLNEVISQFGYHHLANTIDEMLKQNRYLKAA